jgi:hypothetical protein
LRTRDIYLCLSKGTLHQETFMDDRTQIELEAAAFRTLRKHLMEKRTDVQNIDLMNIAGFCRNCLSRWYQEAAIEKGIEMTKDESRKLFYGMTMDEWKTNHQSEANEAKKTDFKKSFEENVGSNENNK